MSVRSLNAELATTASWFRIRYERIPDDYRPDARVMWRELQRAVDEAPSRAAESAAIRNWREQVDALLASRLAAAPLTPGGEK